VEENMKVRWTLYNMSPVKNQHLNANLEYWKMDLVLKSTELMEKIKKSKFLKVMSKGSEGLKNMMFMVETQAEMRSEDIDKIVTYQIDEHYNKNTTTLLTLYIDSSYFNVGEMAQIKFGARMGKRIAKKGFDRQELIDRFETEIRSTYTKNFKGEILEDDGKILSIYK
jgi:hypothetical protein